MRIINPSEIINKTNADIDNLKSAQYSGYGNTVSYQHESVNTWDLDQTATTTGAMWYGKYGTVTFTFTASTMPAAYTTFEIKCYIDNMPFYNSAKTSSDYLVWTQLEDQTSADQDIAKYQTTIKIGWGANTGTNVKIKGRAISVDKGTLSVTTEVFGS